MADHRRGKRRSYSKAFKRRVVAEALEPGASVASVARPHGLNANMVFLPFDKAHPCTPVNPYGRTKFSIEEMLRD